MKRIRLLRRRWQLFLLSLLGMTTMSSCENNDCPEEDWPAPMYGALEIPYVEDSISTNL